jgi:hypothetical protein
MPIIDSSDASEQSKPESSVQNPPSLDEFARSVTPFSEIVAPDIINLSDISKKHEHEFRLEIPAKDKSNPPIEQQRERARTFLSVGLLSLLTASLIGTAVYIIADVRNPKELSQERRNMHRELITILWTSQVTLAGSALGFYFGSQKDNG